MGSGNGSSADAVTAKEKLPAREAGKAAHRLPTGAYPAVGENSSLRPRSEPEPEPADLFRPARSAEPEPQTTAVPRDGVPRDAGERTSLVRRPDPAPADPTTAVAAVRPDEPTLLSPSPNGGRSEQGDGSNGRARPTSPSRSA
ncbi:hypothetical protein [Pseudonocardia abyssalis]|uniref:hypothetical protein n=1 Tax=Pseudonocardia abyssalis TaxID=2792008 RepID=UPI001C4A5D1C|nr:hypothetical protein [Pseudonocardia abyssalis]MBW0119641.1 hypothetical protein [Pseudonocardia abyssalis]